MKVSEKEREARECIFISNVITKKLDFVRNDLMPVYGRDVTLREVEQALWDQYLKIQNRLHNVFENITFKKDEIDYLKRLKLL